MFVTCEELYNRVKSCVKSEMQLNTVEPGTVFIVNFNNNSASNSYVRGKVKDLNEVGIPVEVVTIGEDALPVVFIKTVKKIVNDPKCAGIIVQLPLPKRFNHVWYRIKDMIPVNKDLDGIVSDSLFIPCTPNGIMLFLKYNNYPIDGSHCVIINRSEIVGKPLARLMLEENATVTVCHSHTANLKEITKTADILVTAVGKKDFITQDMVKDDCLIIDVGINRDENNKMCGDVSKDVKNEKTPVPKGVGLLTRALFIRNCYKSQILNGFFNS